MKIPIKYPEKPINNPGTKEDPIVTRIFNGLKPWKVKIRLMPNNSIFPFPLDLTNSLVAKSIVQTLIQRQIQKPEDPWKVTLIKNNGPPIIFGGSPMPKIPIFRTN